MDDYPMVQAGPNLPACDSSPAMMFQLALQKDMNLDKLEKLLELQERWEANEARKAYHRAMAEFKLNPPEIIKDKAVEFNKTKYKHATLGNVTATISRALSQHGLSAQWYTNQDGNTIKVTCRVTHVMGHFEETSLVAQPDTSGAKNVIQAVGSTITYLQRYSLLSLTGLATMDQDDDGRGASPQAPETPQGLSDKQLSELTDLSEQLNPEEYGGFLKYMGVGEIEAIQAAGFNRAKIALMKKLAMKGGAA